jgi:eukaryotic-like serine/threonine-protein kinase
MSGESEQGTPREAESRRDAAPGGRPALGPGARLRHYEILRELGRGGRGIVYLARDTRLGRRVAIKVMLKRSAGGTGDFLREARATASCNHENIVVIHEADEHEGVPYMVLEHLEGADLRGVAGGQRLPPNRAVELIVPVVRALVSAHALGMIHRDLKPENVFVTASGTVKVLDFGIAALQGDGEGGRPLTGTLPYMAPEQFERGATDERSDLWAVGVMLYELLAGHHPVQPLTREGLLRQAYFRDEPLPRIEAELPDLPHRLSQAIGLCLEKQKERRITSAAELLAELEPLLRDRGQTVGDDASPYPGLSAFQEADAYRFYGRGPDVLQLVTRLREYPVAAVVGASGVGKSSFVRAGVVPALRASGERWEILIVRPGREPLQSLATVLLPLMVDTEPGPAKVSAHRELVDTLRSSPGVAGSMLRSRAARSKARVLLFVDQLEELYTLVSDEAERRAFTACLAGIADDASAPPRLVVSIRSDFLDRVGEDRHFLDELVRALHFLQPLPRAALRAALELPVVQLGYSFESGEMLGEMVDSLSATAGALPLLQFAGSKLWEARDTRRKVLTAESYAQMGGISGVLAQHADQVVSALPTTLRSLARPLFQRLVTAEGTRAIVDLSELEGMTPDPPAARGLVEHLAQARLVVLQNRADEGKATVEIVHESLINGWPTLRRWLDEERDELAFLDQLRAAAKQWELRGKPQGLVWRGEAFEEARQWRARHRAALPDRDQAYLDAVIEAGTRAQRLRRRATLGAIGLLSAIVAGGAIAFVQVRRAETSAIKEAARARQAEDRIKQQIEVIQQEQAAKTAAETQVERGKEDLRTANLDLQKALARAETESKLAQTESKRAQDAAAQSRGLADTAQQTNVRLEKLLADERARAEKLEKERRKIASELR